jgi:hypothetical protein
MAKVKFSVAMCDGPDCGEQVVWRRAESGTFSYTCQHCDFRGYAPAGSQSARAIEARYAPKTEPEAKPKKAAPEAKPEPKKQEPEAKPPHAQPLKAAAGIWDHLTKAAQQ